jgi:hypothetical protein
MSDQTHGADKAYWAPIGISWHSKKYVKEFGGVEFNDCYIYDNKDRPCILVSADEDIGDASIMDISGQVYVYNLLGAKADLGNKPENLNLKIKDMLQ